MSGDRVPMIDEVVARVEALMAERRRRLCSQPPHRAVSMVQIHILMALQERGALTVSAVAGMLQVAAPSASAIVDRMEEHGLVRRSRDRTDRRVVHVEITDAGRDTVRDVMGVHLEEMRTFLATMTAGELAAVLAGLRAVCTAMARGGGEGPAGHGAVPPAGAVSYR